MEWNDVLVTILLPVFVSVIIIAAVLLMPSNADVCDSPFGLSCEELKDCVSYCDSKKVVNMRTACHSGIQNHLLANECISLKHG